MFLIHNAADRHGGIVEADELPRFHNIEGALARHAYAAWRLMMLQTGSALKYEVIGPKGRLP
ncbi:hypothetical protein [Mesorhizobium sp. M0276]|uniref:hypothetical protein n=1 Tax=Mesorhizobium sp. M0276 TaxID=2956928 RepID=UPI0033398BE6